MERPKLQNGFILFEELVFSLERGAVLASQQGSTQPSFLLLVPSIYQLILIGWGVRNLGLAAIC